VWFHCSPFVRRNATSVSRMNHQLFAARRRSILCIGLLCLLCDSAQTQTQSANTASRTAAKDSTADYMAQGKALGGQGKWKEAEAALRVYRNRHPDQENAVVLHAEALVKINQPFDAALELQTFIKGHPDVLRPHEMLAVLAASTLKDVALAGDELRLCVQISPKDFQAWESLGELYIDKADAEKAVDSYQHGVLLRPNDAVAAAALAHAYSMQGLPDKATAEFDRARKLLNESQKGQHPSRVDQDAGIVSYLYGQFLASQGRGAESVKALTRALEYNPHSAATYYWRARAYESMKDFSNEERDALEAVKIAPMDKEGALLLISFYRKSGDIEKAQKYADVVRKISETEQAQQSYGRDLRDTLDKAEPLLMRGDFAQALPLYESLIRQLPTFYEAYFDLGMCYGQTGRPHDAEAAFRKFLEYQPVSADGHASLGVLLLGEGRGQEAVPELEQALQIDPSLTEARKALATEYLHESKPKAAVAVLRPAENEKDEEVLVLLAAALQQSSSYTGALAVVNRALDLRPDDARALEIKKQIQASTKRD